MNPLCTLSHSENFSMCVHPMTINLWIGWCWWSFFTSVKRKSLVLKFSYSEKATKILKNHPLLLTIQLICPVNVKTKRRFFSKFVAFSQCRNFTWPKLLSYFRSPFWKLPKAFPKKWNGPISLKKHIFYILNIDLEDRSFHHYFLICTVQMFLI